MPVCSLSFCELPWGELVSPESLPACEFSPLSEGSSGSSPAGGCSVPVALLFAEPSGVPSGLLTCGSLAASRAASGVAFGSSAFASQGSAAVPLSLSSRSKGRWPRMRLASATSRDWPRNPSKPMRTKRRPKVEAVVDSISNAEHRAHNRGQGSVDVERAGSKEGQPALDVGGTRQVFSGLFLLFDELRGTTPRDPGAR